MFQLIGLFILDKYDWIFFWARSFYKSQSTLSFILFHYLIYIFFLSRQISELILLSEIVLEINCSFIIFVVKCLIFIGARKWLGFALFKIISAISRIGLILAIDLSYWIQKKTIRCKSNVYFSYILPLYHSFEMM